jgi:hypothetical protein
MRRLPYRAVRCEHCTSEDAGCEFCDGSHRMIERINDRKMVTEAIDNWLRAARGYLAAVKGLGK